MIRCPTIDREVPVERCLEYQQPRIGKDSWNKGELTVYPCCTGCRTGELLRLGRRDEAMKSAEKEEKGLHRPAPQGRNGDIRGGTGCGHEDPQGIHPEVWRMKNMDRVICESLAAAYRDGAMIHEDAPTISEEALAHCRRVLTDEWLDFMAERFRRLAIRYWTGAEFHQYLLCAEPLEAEADRKRSYMAFRVIHFKGDSVVATTN